MDAIGYLFMAAFTASLLFLIAVIVTTPRKRDD